VIVKLGTANPLGPWLRAFNPFNGDAGIPGAIEADTGAMTITIALGSGMTARTSIRHMNFFLRVDPAASDEFKRTYAVWVHPQDAPPPLPPA